MPPEDTDHVQLDQNTLLLNRESPETITVTWDPPSLLPTMDPSSYRVNISLYRFISNTDGGGEFRPFSDIGLTNQENNGRAVFSAEAIGSDGLELDVYPVAVRISVAGPSQATEQSSILNRLSGIVAQWTSTLYYALSMRLETLCIRWCATQRTGIGESIRNRLPPCPPRVDQARTPNSGFTEDSGFWTQQTNRFFHPDAATCFRQNSFTR